uniref:DUF1275 domain-containing protein n=1 Tax=Angiostrongylus cantonensis TaxID=6313 RepID=A0A0K0DJQ6_ANGCA
MVSVLLLVFIINSVAFYPFAVLCFVEVLTLLNSIFHARRPSLGQDSGFLHYVGVNTKYHIAFKDTDSFTVAGKNVNKTGDVSGVLLIYLALEIGKALAAITLALVTVLYDHDKDCEM